MNERLKQLAMLANIEFTYDPTENPPKAFAECWEDELEKFAESIVRECSNKIEDQKATAPPQVAAGLNFAQVIIKEYFGVEQ